MSDEPIEYGDQLFHPSWTFEFMDIEPIGRDRKIVPIELKACPSAEEYGDLHLIADDFEHSLQCFAEASKFGIPDPANVLAKALIFSAVMAYARPFSSGVRVKLTPEMFDGIWNDNNKALHTFLFELRNRHVAHSVNDFERCDAVGVIVTYPGLQREGNSSGVGVTSLSTIGLTASKIQEAQAHIPLMVEFVRARINELKIKLHAEMKAELAAGTPWKMAPMIRFPDTTKIAKRRSR